MRVRILNANTHVGQALREGGLKRCAVELDADIVTVQEVSRVSARARLRMQFPPNVWGIHGFVPPSIGPSSAGNHVLWKKELWRKVNGRRELISKQVWQDGKRDKWHPSRRLAQVRLLSNTEGDKRLAVASDHLWTIAGHDINSFDRIVHGHKKQARAQADVAWDAIGSGFDVVHAGDQNERMGWLTDTYMQAQYASRRMRHALPANARRFSLDAAFVSPGVKVVSFDWIPKHLLTTDHDGFLLVVEI